MKQIKRILSLLIIVTILIPTLCPFLGISNATGATQTQLSEDGGRTPGLTANQQNYIAKYVRVYLAEAHKMNPVPFVYDDKNGGYEKHFFQNEILTHCCEDPEHEYSSSELGQTGTTHFGPYSNRMRTVCSVFTASMLHQALGVDLWDAEPRGAGFAQTGFDEKGNPNRGEPYFNSVSENEALQPGDIISYSDFSHSIIFIGENKETGIHEWAQTNGLIDAIGISNVPGNLKGSYITLAQLNAAWTGNKSLVASRLKPEVANKNWDDKRLTEPTIIQWPNGSITTWQGEIEDVSTQADPNAPLFYAGLANKIGSLGRTNPIKTLFEAFNEFIDYLIGMITAIIRVPFVGLTRAAELMITSIATAVSTQPIEYALTLEKIVYNQVPFLDVNIFKENSSSSKISVITVLKNNIASWYIAFRNLVIVILLVILVYLGIRMAITSIAEEKAQYKRMLVDWFISFFLVLFIQYFIVIVMNINDFLVNLLLQQSKNVSTGSFYEYTRVLAHSMKFTEGWYGAILYIALVWYMAKYAWKYTIRLLNTFILIILSPFVAVSYALDKIKDSRSQSLAKWLKEIAFTVLIQSVHALIYTVFVVGIVSKITVNNNILQAIGVCVFLFIAIKFMDAAEDVFENIFGFKASSSTAEIMTSTLEMAGKYKMVKNVAGKFYKYSFKGAKWIGSKAGKNIVAGYKLAKDGIVPDEGTKTLATDEAIKKQAQKNKEKLDKQTAIAKKTWKTATGAVKSIGSGMAMLMENPMAGITNIITGGIQAANAGKYGIDHFDAVTANNPFKEVAEQKAEREALLKQRARVIAQQTAEDLYMKEIVEKAKANGIEEKDIEDIIRILTQRMNETTDIISKESVLKVVKPMFIKEAGNITIKSIVAKLEKGQNVDIDIDNFYINMQDEMRKALLNSMLGEKEAVTFDEEAQKKISELMLDERTQDKVWKIMNEKEKGLEAQKAEVEAILNEKIQEYFKGHPAQDIDKIINNLGADEIATLVVRSVNRDGSIRRDTTFMNSPEDYQKEAQKIFDGRTPETLESVQHFAEVVLSQYMPEGTQTEEFSTKFQEHTCDNIRKIVATIQGTNSARINYLIEDDELQELHDELENDGIDIATLSEAELFERLPYKTKRNIYVNAVNDIIRENDNTATKEASKQIVEQAIKEVKGIPVPKTIKEAKSFAKRFAKRFNTIHSESEIGIKFGTNIESILEATKEPSKRAEIKFVDDDIWDELEQELKNAKEDESVDERFEKLSAALRKKLLIKISGSLGRTPSNAIITLINNPEEIRKQELILQQGIKMREETVQLASQYKISAGDLAKDIRRDYTKRKEAIA